MFIAGFAGGAVGHRASVRYSRETKAPLRLTKMRSKVRARRPPNEPGGISAPSLRAENRPSNRISTVTAPPPHRPPSNCNIQLIGSEADTRQVAEERSKR